MIRDGVELRHFPLQPPRIWLASWPLRRALSADVAGFDLVHVHSLYLFHDGLRGAARRRAKVPYLVRPHGALDPYIHRRRRAKKAIFDHWFQNRMLAGAAAIHYTAEEEMRLASPFVHGAPGDRRAQRARSRRVCPAAAGGDFRRRHPEIGEAPIVLFFGRLNFKKGLDILADAFARLGPRAAGAWLVIAGPDGGYRTATEGFVDAAGIRDRTIFTGLLQGEDKLAALADADLFVLPSYSENFGIAVIEAMACGLPVVISDKVNIWREIVADGAGLATPATPRRWPTPWLGCSPTRDCAARWARPAGTRSPAATNGTTSRRRWRRPIARSSRGGGLPDLPEVADQGRQVLADRRVDVHGALDDLVRSAGGHQVEQRVHHLVALDAEHRGAEDASRSRRRPAPS